MTINTWLEYIEPNFAGTTGLSVNFFLCVLSLLDHYGPKSFTFSVRSAFTWSSKKTSTFSIMRVKLIKFPRSFSCSLPLIFSLQTSSFSILFFIPNFFWFYVFFFYRYYCWSLVLRWMGVGNCGRPFSLDNGKAPNFIFTMKFTMKLVMMICSILQKGIWKQII